MDTNSMHSLDNQKYSAKYFFSFKFDTMKMYLLKQTFDESWCPLSIFAFSLYFISLCSVPFRSVTFLFSMDSSLTSSNNSSNHSSGSTLEETPNSIDLNIYDTPSDTFDSDTTMKSKVGMDNESGSGEGEGEEVEEGGSEEEEEEEEEVEERDSEEEEDGEYVKSDEDEKKAEDPEKNHEVEKTKSDESVKKSGKGDNDDDKDDDANRNVTKREVRNWLDRNLLVHGSPPKDGRNFRSQVYKNGGIRFLFWDDGSQFENWFACVGCDWVGYAVPRKGTSLLSKHAR